MTGGYMGKVLWVDLSKGVLRDEELDEKLCRDFIGGYGLGARKLYSLMKGGTDPLGPENILGFVTGPLTGSPALGGSRFAVVCKSPLTGTWGDSNCGGDFGPSLKFTGYDGVFFTGASPKPVYLYIEDGKAQLIDADELWGKDSFQIEDILAARHGGETKVACIGPSGEKLSLISCIMHYRGRAAGRSGVGAVMGSKKLKAIAVKGGAQVPIANETEANSLRKKHLNSLLPNAELFRKFGTCNMTVDAAYSGITPVKNWGGVAIKDFPDVGLISGNNVIALQVKKEACWRCPLGCGGRMKAGSEYKYPDGASKPEYETLAAFGTMCLNSNLESIIMTNDICNRFGLDTMSTGGTIAFAIECYEKGLITKKDTGNLELTWGNHAAVVAMTEQIAKREGFGDILADGVRIAAKKIGKGAEQYAIHIGGQEIGYHDTRHKWHLVATYRLDATPGRHTQGNEELAAPGIVGPFDRGAFSGRGEAHKRATAICHIFNAAGTCQIMYVCLPHINTLIESINAVTGWDTTLDELLKTGERIANIRHAFNLREGINPLQFKVPARTLGKPPQTEGPNAGVSVDEDTLNKEYLATMDWDDKTTIPSRKKLEELGLDDVANDLWG